MCPITGLVVGLVANLLVVWGGYAAYQDKMFSLAQMRRERCLEYGLPFLSHGGMWGDLLIVSPLLAVMVSVYGQQWNGVDWFDAGLGGLLGSLVLHELYRRGKLPSCHNRGGKLTDSGVIHAVYMAGAFTILLLFYFATKQIGPEFLFIASGLLVLHLLAGTHMIRALFACMWPNENPLRSCLGWTTNVVAWLLIGWRCWVIQQQ